MTDATTFILIAGLAFFFFLAPSKNFKQAFQALAFVLFIGLAIMTISSNELTITETNIIAHDYTDIPIGLTETLDLDFSSEMIADGFLSYANRQDTDGPSLEPKYNANNDILQIWRTATEKASLQSDSISKQLQAPGAIKAVHVTLTSHAIPDIRVSERLLICADPQCFSIIDRWKWISDLPRDEEMTLSFILTNDLSYAGRDVVYLGFSQVITTDPPGTPKAINRIKILDIKGISIEYRPPPPVLLEGSNHTTCLLYTSPSPRDS